MRHSVFPVRGPFARYAMAIAVLWGISGIAWGEARITTVEGTLAPDLSSMELTVVADEFTDEEIVLVASENQSYLGRIEFTFPDDQESNLIQTESGEGRPSDNHGFYWNKDSGATAIVEKLGPNDNKVTFSGIVIRENAGHPKAKKLSDSTVLKENGDSKYVKVKAILYMPDSTGQLKAKGSGQVVSIEQNFALPNATPEGFKAAGTHKAITLTWTKAGSIAYSDKKDRVAPGVVAIVAKNSGGAEINLDPASKVTSGTAEEATDGSCTLTPPENSGDSCIVCDDETNTYLDLDALKQIPGLELSKNVGNTGEASIADVEEEQKYVIALQFSNGLKRSACYIASSANNYDLLELNGEGSGKPEDLRCFIATAAFGSPLDQHVANFRWFRDRALLKFPMGQRLVDRYYAVSPRLARYITDHESIREVVRIILTPVAALLAAARWISEHQTLVGASLILLALLIVLPNRHRRSN